jgi:hypothetical protein
MIEFVTPKGFHVYVGDAEAVHDMFTRRLDLMRSSENYSEYSLFILHNGASAY